MATQSTSTDSTTKVLGKKTYVGIPVEQWSSLAAGMLAGACGVVLGHPLDTLKVRLQTGQNLDLKKQKGFELVKQLYRGVGPPIMTSGIIQSMNFTMYEGAKRHFKSNLGMDHLNAVFFGGLVSGLAISVITTPIGVVKVQQQIRTTKGMIGCMRDIFQIHGFPAFYRSYHLMAFMESFGRGVYLWIYEAAKLELQASDTFRKLFKSEKPPSSTSSSASYSGDPPSDVPERVAAAAIAGMMSWLVVYPLDVVKSKLQVDLYKQSYKGVIDCFIKTQKELGYKGFFRGIGFTMIRAAPVAATILPIYELTRSFILKEYS